MWSAREKFTVPQAQGCTEARWQVGEPQYPSQGTKPPPWASQKGISPMGWVRPPPVSQWKQFSGSPYGLRRSLPRALGLVMGYREREFGDCVRLTGCFKDELKVGKGRDWGGLGRNMHGENERDNGRKGASCVNKGWAVPFSGSALCLISTVCPVCFWNSLTLFPGERLPCVCVCAGVWVCNC